MLRECSETSVVAQGPSSCYESALTDHYRVLRAIGEGSFSQVVLARHFLTGVEVAVKVVRKTEMNQAVLCERDRLMALEHRHLVQLFQVIETTHNLYLVMEHAHGGQLRQFFPRAGGIPEEKVRGVFRSMVCVVHYCHQKGVAHLDLKPENFVVDATGHVKLIDFGLSANVSPGQQLTQFRGTLQYCALEIIREQGYEGPPADVWSLGVSLYFMLTGRRPFVASTDGRLAKLVLQGSYDIPPHVSKPARSLIQQMLRVDPRQRPTLEQVLGHLWLSQGQDSSPCCPSEALPQRPDPAILTTMFDMGFDPYETWVSLANRQFDELMATYLLLQHQRSQRAGCELQAKPVQLRVVGPHPGPSVGPPAVHPNKCTSAPALLLPCGPRQQPEEAKASGQKGAARSSASVPAIPLPFLQGQRPPPRGASQQDSGPSPAGRLAKGQGSASPGTSTRPAPHKSGGWRRVTKRIATGLHRLCCCLPCLHGPASRRSVAPREGGHRPPRGPHKVLPDIVPRETGRPSHSPAGRPQSSEHPGCTARPSQAKQTRFRE